MVKKCNKKTHRHFFNFSHFSSANCSWELKILKIKNFHSLFRFEFTETSRWGWVWNFNPQFFRGGTSFDVLRELRTEGKIGTENRLTRFTVDGKERDCVACVLFVLSYPPGESNIDYCAGSRVKNRGEIIKGRNPQDIKKKWFILNKILIFVIKKMYKKGIKWLQNLAELKWGFF